MTRSHWTFGVLALGLVACTKQEATAGAVPAVLPTPSADQRLTDQERVAAGRLVQRLYAASHGAVVISAIALQSGVFRVTVAPSAQAAKPFDVYLSRDLRLIFPKALPTDAQLATTAADVAWGECLKRKGLRLYGDANQAQTQRQLAELGTHGLPMLVDCATHPKDCAVLGQTTLPVVMFGTQRVASLVPRAVLGQWTGCDPGKSPVN